MEDSLIVDLYWKRDESALRETEQKYGAYCQKIAKNILSVDEDAEECVNDTWHQAWNAIPPQRPVMLGAWLGRIVRNLAINLWHKNHALKRYSGMDALLSELEDCIPAPDTVEKKLEEKELSEILSLWLHSLKQEDRILFVRRYWHGMSLNHLAKELGISPSRLAQRMFRLRRNLKNVLEKEGVSL